MPQKSLDAVAKTFTKQLLKKRGHLERNTDYNQNFEMKTNRSLKTFKENCEDVAICDRSPISLEQISSHETPSE